MDVQQFRYFTTIVEEDFNLSAAAKILLVSQSALSKNILTFEKLHGLSLFVRKKGRLTELTPAGKIVYRASQEIVQKYDSMIRDLNAESLKISGELRIGIPPLFWNLGFTNFVNQFHADYPSISVQTIEAGGHTLTQKYVNRELNFALLVWTKLPKNAPLKLHVIIEDELVAFVSKNNPLCKKEILSWSDLNQENLSLYNETFSIHQLVKNKLEAEHVFPANIVTTQYWDYLLRSIEDTDYLTILPRPVWNLATDKHSMIPFDDPIMWNVCLTERTDPPLSEQELLFLNYALKYFEIL